MKAKKTDYDAIVIGAGVCGAIAAWQIAKRGFRVLMLEAGPLTTDRTDLVARFAGAANKSTGSPYYNEDNNKYAPTQDTQPGYYGKEKHEFKSSYVRRVGGTTWHFLGNMPRMLPSDFKLRSNYQVGEDWPLSYDDLESHYCTAEDWIGVAGNHEQWNQSQFGGRTKEFPMTEIWESYGDRVFKRKLGDFAYEGVPIRLMSTPQARNSRPYGGRPACAGNSSCVPICPIQAKYDATVHVKLAIAEGAELMDRCVVTELVPAANNDLIRSVKFKRWDGTEDSCSGKIVILAAHAIESAKILLISNVGNGSDQVGRNLMDHLQGSVLCTAPEPVYPFRGPPTTSGIDVFRDGVFRSKYGAFRLSLGNDGWGRGGESPEEGVQKLIDGNLLFGKGLRLAVENKYIRQWRFSYSTEMLPRAENRITASKSRVDALGIPMPDIAFSIDDYSRAAFKKAKETCTAIFYHVGGVDVTPQFALDSDAYSGAGHVMGTCRMGTNPNTSVVNADCRSHDHRNLFILGSSVFPTGGTANPTLTAAALTIRSLRAIEQFLQPSPTTV